MKGTKMKLFIMVLIIWALCPLHWLLSM